MMKTILLVILTSLVFISCKRRDPIDQLMDKIAHEDVPSYPFKRIDLPETATDQALLNVLAKRGVFELGHLDFQIQSILAVRKTHTAMHGTSEGTVIDDDQPIYTAVWLDTDKGQKIVLFKPNGTKRKWSGWYYKIYSVD